MDEWFKIKSRAKLRIVPHEIFLMTWSVGYTEIQEVIYGVLTDYNKKASISPTQAQITDRWSAWFEEQYVINPLP